jgi:hypothetical protein
MFGSLQITFSVGPGVDLDTPTDSRTVFGGGGKVQPERFRGLSAVVLLDDFNPTRLRVERTIDDRIGPMPESNPARSRDSVIRDVAARAKVVRDTYEHFTLTGDYIESARRTRLTVLHNPFAYHPLSNDIFNDTHDVQCGPLRV